MHSRGLSDITERDSHIMRLGSPSPLQQAIAGPLLFLALTPPLCRPNVGAIDCIHVTASTPAETPGRAPLDAPPSAGPGSRRGGRGRCSLIYLSENRAWSR